MTTINSKAILVAAHTMNICRLTSRVIRVRPDHQKRIKKDKSMLGRQESDERLYLKWKVGGRALKSMRDVYRETKLRIACYMEKSKKPLDTSSMGQRKGERNISIWREA